MFAQIPLIQMDIHSRLTFFGRHKLLSLFVSASLSCFFLTSCTSLSTAPPPSAAPQVLQPEPKASTGHEIDQPPPRPAAALLKLPATIKNPDDLIFFDNFEYIADRDDPGSEKVFTQKGRWNGIKTIHTKERANGYLYTTTRIPGYTGAFPGGNSSRVLAMEALPRSRGFQTDFYLEYGDGENPAFSEAIPGNVWFQFWIYVNHYGNQRSKLEARNKLIYACNTAYPCHSHKWMLGFGTNSSQPHQQSLGIPSNGDAFLNNGINWEVATIRNNTLPRGEEWKLGQTNTSERITANRWTLMKIHLDTSTQSGKYEAWMRPLGGSWTKIAEWIDGVTPGFTWHINAASVGGHRSIRMPTTIGRASGSPNYDAWIYMDDFAMARSESGLPVYSR